MRRSRKGLTAGGWKVESSPQFRLPVAQIGVAVSWRTPPQARSRSRAPGTAPDLSPSPFPKLASLQNASALLDEAAKRFERRRDTAVERGLTAAETASINAFLRGFERLLTNFEGLPGRPWYRHQIYAPGQYTGYGVKTLPAIREAIELRQWEEANEQIGVVAEQLDAARAAIDRMNELLEL